MVAATLATLVLSWPAATGPITYDLGTETSGSGGKKGHEEIISKDGVDLTGNAFYNSATVPTTNASIHYKPIQCAPQPNCGWGVISVGTSTSIDNRGLQTEWIAFSNSANGAWWELGLNGFDAGGDPADQVTFFFSDAADGTGSTVSFANIEFSGSNIFDLPGSIGNDLSCHTCTQPITSSNAA